MTHRFFIPPDWLSPPTVHLAGDIARQVRTVLRMQPGDKIIVLDNSGQQWPVRLTQVGKKAVEGEITGRPGPAAEPTLRLALYQGTLKGQKFEWVLQKGTELGVSHFVPTICHRSVVGDRAALVKKYGRWQRIIREAAEQSRRGRLPTLAPPLSLAEAIDQAQATPLALMPWEEATGPTLKEALDLPPVGEVALFIGPEGGFTPQEADQARRAGLRPVTLGPRLLRAETAALAVCAIIFYRWDEW